MKDSNPLNAHLESSKAKASSEQRGNRLSAGLNTASSSEQKLNDSAWAFQLKNATTAAERELDVRVLAAKPVLSSSESSKMLFELETSKGRLQVARLSGQRYEFRWIN
jgi:hypothetical protein